jgi:1-deoxy-D-xylulose-5-phosphate synthase
MYLEKIIQPEQIKTLRKEELIILCEEIRQKIIVAVAKNGGHLGASLGAVEMIVALHFVFKSPTDRFFFDVGHQAYTHKLLTGRLCDFDTLRRFGGISGFPRRIESEHDFFGTGHSSTALSAALGFVKADELLKKNPFNVVLLGDGALTAGMAYEALQQVKSLKNNLLILLNDNGMSIDENVGAMHEHLIALRDKKTAVSVFELLQIPYQGVTDGNELFQVIDCLAEYKKRGGIQLLHLKTVKGKGLPQAEIDQILWHSPPSFDVSTGKKVLKTENLKFHVVFGEKMTELAEKNAEILVVSPAMKSGSGLTFFAQKFPERFFDTGITEQHAVTFSAGLAAAGLKVFCSIYSTFLQRAYDQVIHDVCLQNLPVIFCIDRAGLVGSDGATHHGLFDLAFLSCLPNAVICAPSNGSELCAALDFALNYTENPLFIRYPRGDTHLDATVRAYAKGKGVQEKEGEKTAVLALGIAVEWAKKAMTEAEKNEKNRAAALFNMRFLKPIDEQLLSMIFEKYEKIVIIEDGAQKGGLFSAVLAWANENFQCRKLYSLAAPDVIIEHGETEELRNFAGYGDEKIIRLVYEDC